MVQKMVLMVQRFKKYGLKRINEKRKEKKGRRKKDLMFDCSFELIL